MACSPGVGFETLVSHCYFSLNLFGESAYRQLDKTGLPQIRREMLAGHSPDRLLVVNTHHTLPTADTEVGTAILLPAGTVPEPIAAHVIGPRLAAMMAYLVGRHHLSRRGVQEFVEDALGVPVSLGTVGVLERQTAAALAAPMTRPARRSARHRPGTSTRRAGSRPASGGGSGRRRRPRRRSS